uniref:endonuclease/exonuclease/phosphatase family protein n=1 Tax=Thaumasiovibrio occultus TaxID=1891184 RepID=UPI000B3552E7|nr:endonuclease/exonuclease/phosphatase family protein [Thaumasiovibrio occultus]
MKRTKRQVLTLSAVALVIAGVGSANFLGMSFDIPAQAEVITLDQHALRCMQHDEVAGAQAVQPIDRDGRLQVAVWNIYKGNKPGWREELNRYAANADLVLLQEASLTEDFRSYLEQTSYKVSMANAFSFFETTAGVLNLSRNAALSTCAYLTTEPWLKLPKSALYAKFPLSNGETLVVVNLHGINFTIGTEQYQAQLDKLAQALANHEGPMIVAGDFNTWRKGRQEVVEAFAARLSLRQAAFAQDHRIRVLGRPLDHLYYRGLHLVSAHSTQSEASDHNPLIAELALIKP